MSLLNCDRKQKHTYFLRYNEEQEEDVWLRDHQVLTSLMGGGPVAERTGETEIK